MLGMLVSFAVTAVPAAALDVSSDDLRRPAATDYRYDAAAAATTLILQLRPAALAPSSGNASGFWSSTSSVWSRRAAKGVAAADHAVPIGAVSEKAWKVLDRVIEKGAPFPGYKGGRAFENRGPGMKLPESGPNGPISYRQWGANPYTKAVNRGSERLVTGSDGWAYYTTNHYDTFIRFR